MNILFQFLSLTTALSLGALLAGCSTTATNDRNPATTRAAEAAPRSVISEARPPSAGVAKPAVATPPANAPASVPEPGIASSLMAAPEFYRIRPGDTGSRIARTYQLTLTELLALNPGVQWGRLKVGQQIRLHAAK